MSVNKIILVGRLGQNPEVRYIQSGTAVAHFSIATHEAWTDKSGQKQERTEWHRIVAWGKQAELSGQYLTKGRQVYIEGKLQTRQWQDKEGQTRYTTEVQAQTIQFLGGATALSGAATGETTIAREVALPAAPAPEAGSELKGSLSESSPFTEDDIPF